MRRRRALWFSVVFVALVTVGATPARLQTPAPPNIRELYTKTEHQILMRDGIKLFTIVYTPKAAAEPYPFMLHRTPYGSPPY